MNEYIIKFSLKADDETLKRIYGYPETIMDENGDTVPNPVSLLEKITIDLQVRIQNDVNSYIASKVADVARDDKLNELKLDQ